MKYEVGFSYAASILIILFLMITNYLTTPSHLWFIYPAFFLLLWPIGLHSKRQGKYKQYSFISSMLIIAFFITINYVDSPGHPWFLYASFPVIWWPILVSLEERRKTMTAAFIGCISTILYYSVLNALVSPQYPWAIYPSFLVLWWPLAVYYANKNKHFEFSLSGSSLIILFFIIVNVVSTPNTIWAVYPIFVVLWWPLSIYYFIHKRRQYHMGKGRLNDIK